MKKAIFIIMLVLPLFLMIAISVAGRLIVKYLPTYVESVHFINAAGEEITEIEIGKNQVVEISAVVLPELASNKKVEYTLFTDENDPVCSYNEETNEIKGIRYGGARLMVVTDDKKMEAQLDITVIDRNVTGISLSEQSRILRVGESFNLSAYIEPETAENRRVTWSSSAPDLVSVNAVGGVTAKAPTPEGEPVSIIATADDGGLTAVCLVSVEEDLPEMAFYRIGETTPITSEENIIVNSLVIDLADYLRFDEELIDFDEIVFTRTGGNDGTISGQTVTFTTHSGYIIVSAQVIRDGNVIYSCSGRFRYFAS